MRNPHLYVTTDIIKKKKSHCRCFPLQVPYFEIPGEHRVGKPEN